MDAPFPNAGYSNAPAPATERHRKGGKGSIGRTLALMVATLALPMLGLVFAANTYFSGTMLQAARRNLQYSADTTVIALDAHVQRHIALAQALVTSPALLKDDLAEFRAEAMRAFPNMEESWALVSDNAHNQVMNLLRAPGEPLPRRTSIAIVSEQAALDSNAMTISGIYPGALRRDWIASINFPVFRDGAPFRVLSIILSAQGIQRLLTPDKMPNGWSAGIVDQNGRIMARSVDPQSFIGRSAPEKYMAEPGQGDILESASLDGDPVLVAKETSALSGWSVGVAVRKSAFEADLRHTLVIADLVGLGVSLASLLAAFALARQITRPLRELEGNAARLVSGAPTSPGAAPPEIRRIWLALTAAVAARQRAEQRQKILIDELSHRVKNNLAIVQSIATQTLRGAASPQAFATAFEERIASLSAAHSLLTHSAWSGAALSDIVAAAVRPFAGAGGAIAITGSAVTVPANATITLALMLHELATNAVKYGALSRPSGKVEISWSVAENDGRREALLRWVESGGPPAAAPERRGFGSRLLTLGAAQLGGRLETDFAGEGLRCTLLFPLDVDAPDAEILARDALPG